MEDAPDRTFTLTFEMADDGRVRGRIESRIGEGTLRRVSFDPETKKLRFTQNSEMGIINFTATVEGDEMKGDLSVEDAFNAPFTAKRQKPEITAATAAAETSEPATEPASEAEAATASGESASTPPATAGGAR
jgi:hypothetical protein